jgi:cytochrome c oxidase subunit 2
LLFGVVLLACFLLYALSPFVGWWLPLNVASYGAEVDNLYNLILGMTTFFFVLTEVILVYAMIRFGHSPGRKAQYVEGNTRLEVLWTVVPAGLLLLIALVQISVWAQIKYYSNMPSLTNPNRKTDQVIQVTARQWEWRFRYPTKTEVLPNGTLKVENDVPAEEKDHQRIWAERPMPEDLHLVNEVHTWKDANVKIFLKTNDVIHSFFLPNLRLKQDALPGKTIPMWFRAIEANVRVDKNGKMTVDRKKEWELACAELCGGSHYRMRGMLYVHENEEAYNAWLKGAVEAQRKASPERTPLPIPIAQTGGSSSSTEQ